MSFLSKKHLPIGMGDVKVRRLNNNSNRKWISVTARPSHSMQGMNCQVISSNVKNITIIKTKMSKCKLHVHVKPTPPPHIKILSF